MASTVRRSMLRQACISSPSKRPFSTTPVFAKVAQPISRRSNFSILCRKHRAFAPSQSPWQDGTRATAFHNSARKEILPAEPQVVDGTANDPAPVPKPEPMHGSYHWTFERLISVACVPLVIAPFAAGSISPTTDAILCATLVLHSHIGFQAVIIDYVPKKRIPKTRKAFEWGLRAATLTVALGLYEFETNDVGITEAIKRIWTAGKQPS